MYLGLRVLAGALWAAALTLNVGGTAAVHFDVKVELFAWAMFLSFGALILTAWLIVEHIVERESHRNAQLTADAVGEAVGEVVGRDGSVFPITRRGI